jgi:serine/threonine protein kinase
MKDHETRMYPVESSDSFVTISPSYLPLVLHWALNTLSALKFLHSRNIAYGDIDLDETCWLSADLSLLLIGFIDSMFVEPEYNELHRSRDWDLVNVDTDLFAWAALLCILLTKKPGVQNGYSSRLIGAPNARQNIVPDVSGHTDFDTIVGDIVRKCFALEYDTADEVWAGFEVVLQSQGYEVEGYGLKGFDPTSILLSATDNLAL